MQRKRSLLHLWFITNSVNGFNMSTNIKKILLLTIVFFNIWDIASAEEGRTAPKATAQDTEVSFWDLPYLEKAFIDTSPADMNDGIPVGKLEIDSGDKAKIIKLVEEIADKKHGLYDSMLINYKGKLLFESYYLRGRINLPHFQASATKVYTSLALGRAIQLGYLKMTDLDKPLVSFLNDLDPGKLVDGAKMITLHKAMTMRSGIRISDEKRKEFQETPSSLKGQQQVQTWLEHSAPITPESQSYLYAFDPDLVMQVIEAVVPGGAQEFIENELIGKLGISNYQWRNSSNGLPSGGDRTSFTSRDMIKWGILVINKGRWNGEQLISADYLAKATSPITQPTADWQPKSYTYGYFWYQTNIAVGEKSFDAKIAWGGGGQHIVVVEELDLIVAITGHDREDTIMTQISNEILPAFVEQQ